MAKTNSKKQTKASAKAVMAGVRKEMARPRVAESARKKRGFASAVPKASILFLPKPVEIKP